MANYHGRLACDGNGNLIADEGESKGFPVAYDIDTGEYVFVEVGEPSHNDRHHKSFVQMASTVDKSMVDENNLDLVNADENTNQHHFGVTEDDPHYDPDAPNGVRVKFLPDAQAAVATSNTEAYKNAR